VFREKKEAESGEAGSETGEVKSSMLKSRRKKEQNLARED
jgi:hypothetical protein